MKTIRTLTDLKNRDLLDDLVLELYHDHGSDLIIERYRDAENEKPTGTIVVRCAKAQGLVLSEEARLRKQRQNGKRNAVVFEPWEIDIIKKHYKTMGPKKLSETYLKHRPRHQIKNYAYENGYAKKAAPKKREELPLLDEWNNKLWELNRLFLSKISPPVDAIGKRYYGQ